MSISLWGATKPVTLKAADGSEVPIVVKTVGTPEHPFLLSEIDKREIAAKNRLNIKARKELLEIYGSQADAVNALCLTGETRAALFERINKQRKDEGKEPLEPSLPDFDEAVRRYVSESAEYQPVYSRLIRDLVVNGLVDGEKRYHELFNLGRQSLLEAAAQEVRAFNNADPKA